MSIGFIKFYCVLRTSLRSCFYDILPEQAQRNEIKSCFFETFTLPTRVVGVMNRQLARLIAIELNIASHALTANNRIYKYTMVALQVQIVVIQ